MKLNNSKLIYKTITAYKEQNKKFGFSSKGVFWQNDNTQIARFNSLINGILTQDLDGGISISDFGCGYGAFYNYIKNKKFMNNSSFIGYDIVDDFIFEAKKNYPNAEWKCSDKLDQETDYLFISGTLNMAFNYSINEWQRYLESQIEECFINVKKVLAFNLLFAKKRKIEKGLFYSEIDRVFDFCDKNLGNTVITKTPGTEKDITVFVTK